MAEVTRSKAAYEELLQQLGRDFDKRMIEDPDFGAALPTNAYVVFQIEAEGGVSDDVNAQIADFNAWVRDVCRPQIDPDHTPVTVKLVLKPHRRISAHRETSPRLGPLSEAMVEHTPREFELAA